MTELVFLGHVDGEVIFDLELRHAMSRVIRQVRPQVVITQSPTINVTSVYGSHADHVATGQAAWTAVYPDARNPFAHPELLTSGLEPWSVDEIWIMYGTGSVAEQVDTVDITAQIDRKMRALRCHESQHRDPDAMEERVRTWWGHLAVEAGLARAASPSASSSPTPGSSPREPVPRVGARHQIWCLAPTLGAMRLTVLTHG